MILLHVCISMVARFGHKGDVPLEVILSMIPPVGIDRGDKLTAQLHVKGVFACLQKLVIVYTRSAPISFLLMEDVGLFIYWLIGRAPQDTIWMRVPGRQVVPDDTVIPLESSTIIVPMHRHCQRVPNVKPVEGALTSRYILRVSNYRFHIPTTNAI
jgi:hypothetical protein